MRAANAAQAADGEAAALHVGAAQLAFARFLGQLAHFLADLQDAFLVGIFEHGHDQAVGRVGGKTDVEILLVNQRVAVKAGVEVRVFLQRGYHGLDDEGEHGDFDAALFVFLVGAHAEGFQLGDVGLVVVGDVGNHHPVARQVRAADFLDARKLLALDGAELGEVHLGPGQQIKPCAAHAAARGLRLRLQVAGHDGLGEFLHVFLRDAAFGAAALHFGQRHAQFARKFAHAGAGVGQALGLVDGRARVVQRGGGSSRSGRGGWRFRFDSGWRLAGGRWGRFWLFFRCGCGGRGSRCFCGGFHDGDHAAFAHFVAQLHFEFLEHASMAGRNFH